MENEDDSNTDRVSLMTLHGAKGLEFDTVFLPGWEEGIFPNQRSLDESGEKGLEEERRLAYVGLTRARRRAIISHASNRRIYANWQSSVPSRFLDELPESEVERSGSGDYRREARIAAATAFSGVTFPLVARPAATWGGASQSRVIEAWEQPARAARADQVKVGARVFHQKFGYGTVMAAEDDRLDIAFDKAGDKRVLDRYVEVTAEP
jgi:DNA helicase-2/ATP-dependent DNA helicase PcrA